MNGSALPGGGVAGDSSALSAAAGDSGAKELTSTPESAGKRQNRRRLACWLEDVRCIQYMQLMPFARQWLGTLYIIFRSYLLPTAADLPGSTCRAQQGRKARIARDHSKHHQTCKLTLLFSSPKRANVAFD